MPPRRSAVGDGREALQRRGDAAAGAVDGTALVVIDMISCWDFVDGARLARQAQAIVSNIRRLKRRCKRDGAVVIYANDNRGRWRSDFRRLVHESVAAGAPAEPITRALAPDEDDYFVLKPQHSAFYATPLELLLDHLKARRLLLAGVTAEQCVLASAADARMRNYEVIVPRDCIAGLTPRRWLRALEHLEQVLGLSTTPSSRLRLD